MWPIPSALIVKLAWIVFISAGVWGHGFYTGNKRSTLEIQKYRNTALVQQQKDTAELAVKINDSRVKFDAAIKTYDDSLRVMLESASMRERSYQRLSRSRGESCRGARPSELSGMDAELLARYATGAQKVAERLVKCLNDNNDFRNAMRKGIMK